MPVNSNECADACDAAVRNGSLDCRFHAGAAPAAGP
jgi:hypothetical protein